LNGCKTGKDRQILSSKYYYRKLIALIPFPVFIEFKVYGDIFKTAVAARMMTAHRQMGCREFFEASGQSSIFESLRLFGQRTTGHGLSVSETVIIPPRGRGAPLAASKSSSLSCAPSLAPPVNGRMTTQEALTFDQVSPYAAASAPAEEDCR
jgi:hypothetical protein